MPIQGEMGVFQALELQRQTQKETEKGTTLSVDCMYTLLRYVGTESSLLATAVAKSKKRRAS